MLWCCGTGFSPAIRHSTSLRGYASRCSYASGTSVCAVPSPFKHHLTALTVIPADYSTQLTYLLRYPALERPSTSPPSLHPCSLLLRQALTLQMSPVPATGASVVHENQNLLDIPTEVPDPPPPPMRRRPRPAERGTSHSNIHLREDGGKGHVKQGSNHMALPEMIARGLLERGESLGINKTVMNAVSELKARQVMIV